MGSAAGTVSVLDLFSIGIGPSSSHTVGPMRAASRFVETLREAGLLPEVAGLRVVLHGSLGATGLGHGTPDAVVAGLNGFAPETCDPAVVRGAWAALGDGGTVTLAGRPVRMRQDDVAFAPRDRLPGHPNALRLTALGVDGAVLASEVYYSIGGGFLRRDGEPGNAAEPAAEGGGRGAGWASAAELLADCAARGASIAALAREAELAHHDAATLDAGIARIAGAMRDCIEAGLTTTGVLPGFLQVQRRAAGMRERLERTDPQRRSADWLPAYALAVNEENAAGGRVVTAPTNGAAGIVPAVLQHALDTGEPDPDAAATFLLTATAIGSLIKRNATISGADGGCQAEVGSACAMAAAGYCAVLGGTPAQVENAAEIAVEHHLGLTCDPVGGLVQVPCIERNAIAAATAVAAARLALYGDGRHVVPLDVAVETMRQTGLDMSDKYKETSTGGLAVNLVEC
ncbi:L-serine ammonia-lyase [Amnibacterium sp. CER49]|uniref:L-serine ammonia-lyase n=1 Tax=Amnibacterium sp. CER49 TaxID=3039161 RepID=UPI00244C2002|nr:L-serine ammonia-lyase [Amnibacterium sp. CER49]MDH2444754.1 L-serine ammonia-lyase [Amnibacterium sp. CER49]